MSLKQTMQFIEKNKNTYLDKMKASEAKTRAISSGRLNTQASHNHTTLQAARLK